jgi:ribose 5-phosphate isomerase
VMLNNVPGVVNHGLFIGISGIIMLASEKGVQELRRE